MTELKWKLCRCDLAFATEGIVIGGKHEMNVSQFLKNHHEQSAEFHDSVADEHAALEKVHEKIAGLHRSMQKSGSGDFAEAHDELGAAHGRLAARHKLHANHHRELVEKTQKETAAAKAVLADRDSLDFSKSGPNGGVHPGSRLVPRAGQPSAVTDLDLIPPEFRELIQVD